MPCSFIRSTMLLSHAVAGARCDNFRLWRTNETVRGPGIAGRTPGAERCVALRCGAVPSGAVRCVAKQDTNTHTHTHTRDVRLSG